MTENVILFVFLLATSTIILGLIREFKVTRNELKYRGVPSIMMALPYILIALLAVVIISGACALTGKLIELALLGKL